jgi:hypothetical protein
LAHHTTFSTLISQVPSPFTEGPPKWFSIKYLLFIRKKTPEK